MSKEKVNSFTMGVKSSKIRSEVAKDGLAYTAKAKNDIGDFPN